MADEDYKDVVEFSYAFLPKKWLRVERDGYWYPVDYHEVDVYEISAQYAGASIDTGVKNWKSLTFKAENEVPKIRNQAQYDETEKRIRQLAKEMGYA